MVLRKRAIAVLVLLRVVSVLPVLLLLTNVFAVASGWLVLVLGLLMLLLLIPGPAAGSGDLVASCSVVAAVKLELMLLNSLPLNSPPVDRSGLHTTLTVGGFIVVLANA